MLFHLKIVKTLFLRNSHNSASLYQFLSFILIYPVSYPPYLTNQFSGHPAAPQNPPMFGRRSPSLCHLPVSLWSPRCPPRSFRHFREEKWHKSSLHRGRVLSHPHQRNLLARQRTTRTSAGDFGQFAHPSWQQFGPEAVDGSAQCENLLLSQVK